MLKAHVLEFIHGNAESPLALPHVHGAAPRHSLPVPLRCPWPFWLLPSPSEQWSAAASSSMHTGAERGLSLSRNQLPMPWSITSPLAGQISVSPCCSLAGVALLFVTSVQALRELCPFLPVLLFLQSADTRKTAVGRELSQIFAQFLCWEGRFKGQGAHFSNRTW